MFIPFVNFAASIALTVFTLIWFWKITEMRKRPGWLVLLQLIPFFGLIWGLVLLGILAWSKK